MRYSGTVTRKIRSFRIQDYYLLGSCFPAHSAKNAFCNFLLVKDRRYRPTTPTASRYARCRTDNPQQTTDKRYFDLSVVPCSLSVHITCTVMRSVWASPVSLAATQGIQFVYFPPGTEMFHFPGYAPHASYERGSQWFTLRGFPIRTSPDQRLFATSPKLFAGYHVLLRLLPPRHPPYALIHLTI